MDTCILKYLCISGQKLILEIPLRACLHGGGGLRVGEVTYACGRSPHLLCKRDQIKMRDYTDRWVTSCTYLESSTSM